MVFINLNLKFCSAVYLLAIIRIIKRDIIACLSRQKEVITKCIRITKKSVEADTFKRMK